MRHYCSRFFHFLFPHHHTRAAVKVIMYLFVAIVLLGGTTYGWVSQLGQGDQPILSERNPDGTVDYWYLGDSAALGESNY